MALAKSVYWLRIAYLISLLLMLFLCISAFHTVYAAEDEPNVPIAYTLETSDDTYPRHLAACLAEISQPPWDCETNKPMKTCCTSVPIAQKTLVKHSDKRHNITKGIKYFFRVGHYEIRGR